MTRGARGLWRALVAAAIVMCWCGTACSSSVSPDPAPTDERISRSQVAFDAVVTDDNVPGCSAAVAERGSVVWQSARGLAVVDPATPIVAETTFDIGSVSKQFTALAVAMLAEDGQLSLDDTVAEQLDGFPAWAEQVTLAQLIHHTSGIPEVIELMIQSGIGPEMDASHEEQIDAIRQVDSLDFEPGSAWAYSNSNYLLLAQISERITGQQLADQLAATQFEPLALTLELRSPDTDPDRTRAYRTGATGQLEIDETPWDVTGAAGIRGNPGELVRWADVYRTGAVGAALVTSPQLGAVDSDIEDSAYGLGIFVHPDGTLWMDGEIGGFHSAFVVSKDRNRALAVTCNQQETDPWQTADELEQIWQFH